MSETNAMRKTVVATSTALLLCVSSLGCKTAPKMAFWKTTDKSSVESTALAHSAPALPADIAKQAETMAASNPSIQMSGGEAAPYSSAPAFSSAPPYTPAATAVASVPAPPTGSGAKTAPGAYPTTGASPYVSTAPTVASTTPKTTPSYSSNDQSADLGEVAMPYNPNAVPPAKTVAAATPTITPKATNTDRYGMASAAPAYGGANVPPVAASPVATAAAPKTNSGDRYGNFATAAATQSVPSIDPKIAAPATTASATPAYAASGTPAAAGMSTTSASVAGSRYAASSSTVPAIAPTSVASTAPVTPTAVAPAAVAPAAAVASVSPYRPGGTGSYEGAATSSAVEIASRPKTVEQQVPGVATPGTTSEPAQAPRYR